MCSPASRRVQREREERVPKRIVHGDLQFAGQPQQTIVVGQLAVTGSGAHDVVVAAADSYGRRGPVVADRCHAAVTAPLGRRPRTRRFPGHWTSVVEAAVDGPKTSSAAADGGRRLGG